MADNTIHILFDACEPPPAAGYRVLYRPKGSEIAYREWPISFPTTPAVFTDTNDPLGTQYEGLIMGDCGDGKYGVPIPWETEGSESGGESGSEPPPILNDTFRVGIIKSVGGTSLCNGSNTIVAYWTGPGAALVPGNILYTDPELTTPLVGWFYISTSIPGDVFTINFFGGDPGEVGTNAGPC